MNRKAWRSWLGTHSSSVSEAWLVIHKKHAPPTAISLAEAVEEALCFGWIDSTLNTIDNQSYLLRFSPRRPNSIWSMSNIRRVEKLQKSGLMTNAGLAAIQAAKASGQWQAAIERENSAKIPADLEVALCQIEGAVEAYHALPASKRKQYTYWLQSAKREETRKKRISEIIKKIQGKNRGDKP